MTVPVLVLAPPRFIGPLGVMRSLRPFGARVYALSHESISIANSSRFCAGTFAIGRDGRPLGQSEAEIVSGLLGAAERLGPGAVLIAGSDEWSVFVSAHAAALAPAFRFPVVDLTLIDALASKAGLNALATQHGLPTPRIAVPADRDEVERLAAELEFPVMLKPILSRPGRQGLTLVREPAALLPAYRDMDDDGNILCQEFIPGTDQDVWIFNGYFDAESNCLAAFTGQKIRQHPAHQGLCAFGVSRQNQEVIEITVDFLKRAGYRGVVDIGYRYDRRDGRYKVLDINPRLGGAFRIFVDRNGLDVVRAMYLDLTGGSVPPVVPHDGRKWMLEAGELLAYRHYKRDEGLTLRSWLRSLHGLAEGATWSPTDPRPFANAMRILVADTFAGRRAAATRSSRLHARQAPAPGHPGSRP